MTVYEMRTYTLHVGKMPEAVKLYTEFGYPALQIHLWKFDDDADRRAHWASVSSNKDFVEGLPSDSVRCSFPRRSSC
jgi:hypothetical protein